MSCRRAWELPERRRLKQSTQSPALSVQWGPRGKNLLVGFGNSDADMGALTDNLIGAFQNVIENITPIIKNIVAALPEAFDAIMAGLSEMFPAAEGVFSAISGGFSWLVDNSGIIAAAAVAIGAAMVAWNVVTTVQAVIGAVKAWKIATEGMAVSQQAFECNHGCQPCGNNHHGNCGPGRRNHCPLEHKRGFPRNKVTEIWEAIKNAFITAWEAITELWSGAGEFFSGVWEGITNAFSRERKMVWRNLLRRV